jgi:phosphopantothenoylcysteine decarboxylase/phosphopantothenate--cysteine ligase
VNAVAGRRILLGVTGGIAAYKTPDLVRRLRERGADVRVVMTASAGAFIGELSLQAVSGNPVRSGLLDADAEAGMGHIELARWADQVLIAPATADRIARLAAGLADDLLGALVLATDAAIAIAPAMNHRMWDHPATQENLSRLTARGVSVLGPGVGAQACGDNGPGRMLEPDELAELLLSGAEQATARPLRGQCVLLTVGPTREPLDPVRFIGNRSSGRMGFALAEAMAGLGASVEVVAGPTPLPPPPGLATTRVETAAQMYEAVMARVSHCDLFIGTAAVADYRPATPAPSKLKKTGERLTMELVRNPDIVQSVAALPERPFTVGFAAETDELETHARAKLETKRLDMVAANLVAAGRGGFEDENNALLVLWDGGRRSLPMMPKPRLAAALAELIAERYAASTSD